MIPCIGGRPQGYCAAGTWEALGETEKNKKKGNLKEEFAFNPVSETILLEIYELKNKVKHLHSLLEVYLGESEELSDYEREKI